MKIDGKHIDRLEAAREARRELAEFEGRFDEHMPSAKKLREFRSAAKDILDAPSQRERPFQTERSSLEERTLRERMQRWE